MQVIGNVQNLILGGAKVYVMPDDEYLELGLLRGQTSLTVTNETVQVEQGCPRKLVANFVRKAGASLSTECMDISPEVMSLATGLPLESQQIEVVYHEAHDVAVTPGAEGEPATCVVSNLPNDIDPDNAIIHVRAGEPMEELPYEADWSSYGTSKTVTLLEPEAGEWGDIETINEVRIVHMAPGPQEISIGTNSEVPTLNGVVLVKFNPKTNKSLVVEMPFVQANGGLNLVYDNDANDVMAIGLQLDAVSNPSDLDASICTIREVNGEYVPGQN